MGESLIDEHARLIHEVKALQREHDELTKRRVNIAEHQRHKARLHEKVRELRAHYERLQRGT